MDHRGGPLLVLAGAGTGKTATLAARVARRVLDGVPPHRLLLLSFSRRAAQELAQRAGRLVHQALGWPATTPPPPLPWAGTFHGVAARLLRERPEALGLAAHFSILDRGDAEDLLGLARQRVLAEAAARDPQTTRQRFPLPGTCLAIYSRTVNTQRPLARVLADDFPWCAEVAGLLKAVFHAYQDDKAVQSALDYDDLLLAWARLMDDTAIAAHLGSRFDEVLVDEYQDTNRLQATILQRLKPDGRGLTVVGDDAQSIYAFRAAEVGNILGFAAGFTPPARTVLLERNYRSTQPVLEASNAVIALSPQRHAKTLWTPLTDGPRPRLVTVDDDLAQARWVADGVLAQREEGVALKQQAVLFRTAHHAAPLELELTRRNIPFVKFGGLKFLEAAHVKDFLALLRWAHNPRCTLAAWRSVRLVPGIGPGSAKALVQALDGAPEPLATALAWSPPPRAASGYAKLAALLRALADADARWPEELAAVHGWLAPQFERLYPEDAALRLGDIEQLLRLAATRPSREHFLTELTLDPPEATSDWSGPPHRDEDYLILSTLHSAKGQEWSAVRILNVVDGCMPADLATGDAAQVEEERRLLYVGMTRARRDLELIVPLRFHVTQQARGGDRHLYGGLSRFIPPEVARHFDRVAAGAVLPEAPTAAPWPDAATRDLRQTLRIDFD